MVSRENAARAGPFRGVCNSARDFNPFSRLTSFFCNSRADGFSPRRPELRRKDRPQSWGR